MTGVMNTIWNGKKKAVTFSYDDGVLQDRRLVEIFNRYGLRATFNVNSGMLYHECIWNCRGVDVVRMTLEECKEVFANHEIACHSLTHVNLAEENDYQLERQIVGDKINLENLFGREIHGMAYPAGGHDQRVQNVLKKFGLYYGRTIHSEGSFSISPNLWELSPTCHHNDPDLMKLAQRFLEEDAQEYKLFYLWGHSYEFDCDNNWEQIENFCKYISGRDDVFYGTNHEVLSPFYQQKQKD